MLDHKEVLQAMVRGVNGRNAVYVREANFGYVIRSERGMQDNPARKKLSKFTLLSFVLAAAGIWLVPGAMLAFPANVLVSSALMAVGFIAFVMIHKSSAAIELHVDVHRRELRSAVVTQKGESWIRSCAGFDEVSDVYMRKVGRDAHTRSLCFRIVGDDDLMPVAIGGEKVLMPIHDRLMRDLRSQKETFKHLGYGGPLLSTPASYVFPQLGPDE